MWSEFEAKYDSLNLKENILTQAKSVKQTLEKEQKKVNETLEKLNECSNIILTGAGDKYIIPLISGFIFRNFTDEPIEVFHSRTLLENKIKIKKNTAMIFLSQSGTTFDTLSAYKNYKSKNKLNIWITNLKKDTKGSIYEFADNNCAILNTHTFYYPEKPIISTSTFQTSLVLLNDLLLGRINSVDSINFRNMQKEELPTLMDKLIKNKKVIEWAKNNAIKMKNYRNSNIYVLGDGIRYYIARKQALIMFMEGCKQDASAIETEEFVHSLIETLEPENPNKKPLLILKPLKNSNSSGILKLIKYITSLWKKYAGEEKIISFSISDFVKIGLNKENANLLSPFLYIIPLEWLTFYYAISMKIDPGLSNLVNKVRSSKID
jgi:glucosamine--fructose-6-phosphate aminotransferase (isomerizing)